MKRVLFVCGMNSARSQMAEGLMRNIAGDQYQVESAGLKSSQVHPMAREAMAAIGIDISGQSSNALSEFEGQEIDLVITVCDQVEDRCLSFGTAREFLHKPFRDPAAATGSPEEKRAVFGEVRDEIRAWIKQQFGKNREASAS